jgi:hypothetical protein
MHGFPQSCPAGPRQTSRHLRLMVCRFLTRPATREGDPLTRSPTLLEEPSLLGLALYVDGGGFDQHSRRTDEPKEKRGLECPPLRVWALPRALHPSQARRQIAPAARMPPLREADHDLRGDRGVDRPRFRLRRIEFTFSV